MFKKLIATYFAFSTKETIAIIIAVAIMLALVAIPSYYTLSAKNIPLNAAMAQQLQALQQSDSVEQQQYINYGSKNFASQENVVFNPFIFNPNTASETDWQQLGLRLKTIKTIINYRNKGGKFYKPEDIKKIWGITTTEANRLIPYIQIPNNFTAKPATPIATPVLMNTATAAELKIIPGLQNDGLAYKIVAFREKLGGFISIDQIKETYGITDSCYLLAAPYFKFSNTNIVRKININTASDVELNNHPYIAKNIAKAIVVYRTQNGNYNTVADIKKIVFIKEPLFNKIAPYLTVE